MQFFIFWLLFISTFFAKFLSMVLPWFMMHTFFVIGFSGNMSSSRVSIDKLPALKMIFHASKHAECAVNGLLLCKPTADSNTGASTLRICDYVPLFHSALNLAPMLEVALCQVCSSSCSHPTSIHWSRWTRIASKKDFEFVAISRLMSILTTWSK